jgi:ubiquinone/menaquinone biosynthesis C-methylase UbiE
MSKISTSSPSTSPARRNSDDDLSFLEKFRYINGRRFHNEESTINYYVPNDSEESNRLNLQHYLLRYVWKGNFSSPITEILSERNASVLDIGCCAGTWVLDMAQKYSQSSFIGIDISRMYPSSDKTPLNAIFLQHNILEGLPWPPNTFDFVYKRFLSLSFTLKDLTKMINEVTRVTKIGGWIEVMNYGNSLKNSGKSTKKLMDACKFLYIYLFIYYKFLQNS